MRAFLAVAFAAIALAGCQTVGSSIGRVFQPDLYAEMADADVTMAVDTMQAALETAPDGSGSSWSNPQTGNQGRITPQRTYQTDAGFFCRDYSESLTVGGRTAVYDRSACRLDDGAWHLRT